MRYEGWQDYSEEVERLCGWLWNRYRRFILSKEDLVQTGYYLLLLALENHREGEMEKRNYVLWYVRKKLLNMLFGGENAPKHNGYPFTFVKDRNSKIKVLSLEEEWLEKCIDGF